MRAAARAGWAIIILLARAAPAAVAPAPGYLAHEIATPDVVHGGVVRHGDALLVGQGTFGAGGGSAWHRRGDRWRWRARGRGRRAGITRVRLRIRDGSVAFALRARDLVAIGGPGPLHLELGVDPAAIRRTCAVVDVGCAETRRGLRCR